MKTHKTLFQAILARISLGAVPVDGSYWFDPKDSGTPATGAPDAETPSAGIPTAGTSKSPGRRAAPGRDWPPASLSWFLPRP